MTHPEPTTRIATFRRLVPVMIAAVSPAQLAAVGAYVFALSYSGGG
jgi:hypothetical protein